MKLIVFEGYNDLQFFRSFFTKVMNAKVITSKAKSLVNMFKGLVAENPEMARVEVLLWENEKLLLLSVGGKDNLKLIAEGLRPLVNVIKRNEEEDITGIVFITDDDAKEIVDITLKGLNDLNLRVKTIFYKSHLEDLILSITRLAILDDNSKNLLESITEMMEKIFEDDKYIKKRKVGIVHAIVGPKCFGHLFDELFIKINPQEVVQDLDVFKELIDWLND